ncbi:baseplate J/gp47 family protein [Clostridium sp.]|uniref:baseplate J/gp47 family protein n=1 Tax=Clostridium sp. TaxID=1506 RepID=UPI0028473B2E|nr:baseplate J/gp47 family protein [Clostridium sp.]MDR3595093.1 baseplate J/gp47 family protein [Clostridium sp.]
MAYSEDSATILNRMLGNISDTTDKTEGYIAYDIPSAVSQEMNKALIKMDNLASKFDISNLTGDELASRVYERTGLTRNDATYATTNLTITGNVALSVGQLFQTPSRIQFSVNQATTISGTGAVPVQAVIAGSTGNVPAGQITQMPISISGITSVTNLGASSGGYDAESDSSLLERYYEKLQSPQTGGNIAYFTSLAKDYSGVGDVKVYPTWNGNNTILLVVIDANKLPPSTDFINTMQTVIDPLGTTWGQGYGTAPYGAFTTVEAATALSINVSFTAVKDTNYSDAQRQTNFENALTNYLQTIAFNASSVSYSKIGALIIDTPGFLDYTNLTVNGSTVAIPLTYASSLTQCPVIGTVTIS